MRLRIKPRDLLFVILALLLVLLYTQTAGPGFPLDDSWIHQVYARNLAQTGEWAFIPGQPSAASTSPLYTVVLAFGYLLNLPYGLWTHLVGALALAVTAMLGARLAEKLAPQTKHAGWLTGLALVLSWHLTWAAVSGMETVIFCMFTLALIALCWRELDAEPAHSALRGVGFGVVAGLTTLTRPEGVLLVGMAGLIVLIMKRRLYWSVLAAVAFLVVMTPYLLLNYSITGGLLPDTASAKVAQMMPYLAKPFFQRVIEMFIPLAAGGQILLLPGMIYYTWVQGRRLERWPYLLPVIWAVSLILLYAARLPSFAQHGRYVIPALPALIVVGTVGTLWLLKVGAHTMPGRVLTRTLAVSAVLAFIYFGVVAGPAVHRTDVAIIEEEMVAAAMWIRDNIPQDELLAAHDIGAVGYFAMRPLVDIAGLITPEAIPIYHDKEAIYDLMAARGAKYLMALPDQVPGGDLTDTRLCPVFVTGGDTSLQQGGGNMTVYRLAWNHNCSDNS